MSARICRATVTLLGHRPTIFTQAVLLEHIDPQEILFGLQLGNGLSWKRVITETDYQGRGLQGKITFGKIKRSRSLGFCFYYVAPGYPKANVHVHVCTPT